MDKRRADEDPGELATQLLIKKPTDHILYLKQCFPHAARNRDVPRIILLAPPGFDKFFLAEFLKKELGVRPISFSDVQKVSSTDIQASCAEAEYLTKNMKKMLRSGLIHYSGWILFDLPRNKAEAQAMQRVGIIPTHVIEIKMSKAPELECKRAKNAVRTFEPPLRGYCDRAESAEQRRYVKRLRGLRDVYADLLIEVDGIDRNINDIGKICATLARIRKPVAAPCQFRVILIGANGSDRETLAKHVSERFNLVHLDFAYILEESRSQDTSLGRALRIFEHKWGKRPNADMRIELVEKRILSYECTRRGWILTGYPITAEDFKLLDLLSTPPNRVIFLEVDLLTCRERLLGRRYDIHTGSTHNIIRKYGCKKSDSHDLAVHPNDRRSRVEEDIREYQENLIPLMEYAGKTGTVIDGNGDERIVREKLEACLVSAAPCASPRIRKPSFSLEPDKIEFDPDDEPDPRIFNEIREKETTLSLV
ncbi:adenylate kinase 8 isoform X2 [Cephus cinctus]|uniref:Adenylate kinase 8 isoform X2 n=1 Tax=Cephus cinctus TaxID=211228 RepID=A0AAJ7RV94_CEPCN|nr:adenylate kinase 8 isoform X2 [Cephus cinctus]